MDTTFNQKLQQWLIYDTQLKQITEKSKEIRDKKHELTQQIHNHIETHPPITNTIEISGHKLKFCKTKETQPLTFKFLEACLEEIITNEEQVRNIMTYIKNKREITYVPEIKRTTIN